MCYYWAKKVEDPTFCSENWGGARNSKYEGLEDVIQNLIWNFITAQPQCTLKEVCLYLNSLEINYTHSNLSKLFKRWRWSFKIPTVQQIEKYTFDNLEYYLQFCERLLTTPDLRRVKFLDEVHFDSKGMLYF